MDGEGDEVGCGRFVAQSFCRAYRLLGVTGTNQHRAVKLLTQQKWHRGGCGSGWERHGKGSATWTHDQPVGHLGEGF